MKGQLTLPGVALRDKGVSSVAAHTPAGWRTACDLAIEQLAATLRPFTAEDVRRLVGDPPNHPNAMGARFLLAVRAGKLEKIGHTTPGRPSRHSNALALWRGIP